MGQTTYEEELAAKKELVESYIGKYCKTSIKTRRQLVKKAKTQTVYILVRTVFIVILYSE